MEVLGTSIRNQGTNNVIDLVNGSHILVDGANTKVKINGANH